MTGCARRSPAGSYDERVGVDGRTAAGVPLEVQVGCVLRSVARGADIRDDLAGLDVLAGGHDVARVVRVEVLVAVDAAQVERDAAVGAVVGPDRAGDDGDDRRAAGGHDVGALVVPPAGARLAPRVGEVAGGGGGGGREATRRGGG